MIQFCFFFVIKSRNERTTRKTQRLETGELIQSRTYKMLRMQLNESLPETTHSSGVTLKIRSK